MLHVNYFLCDLGTKGAPLNEKINLSPIFISVKGTQNVKNFCTSIRQHEKDWGSEARLKYGCWGVLANSCVVVWNSACCRQF